MHPLYTRWGDLLPALAGAVSLTAVCPRGVNQGLDQVARRENVVSGCCAITTNPAIPGAFFGLGTYDTRHLTGGALVKRPKTASPCFRRPGGRLQFEGGGTWHEETPLVSAERRGTVRGSVKVKYQGLLSVDVPCTVLAH